MVTFKAILHGTTLRLLGFHILPYNLTFAFQSVRMLSSVSLSLWRSFYSQRLVLLSLKQASRTGSFALSSPFHASNSA